MTKSKQLCTRPNDDRRKKFLAIKMFFLRKGQDLSNDKILQKLIDYFYENEVPPEDPFAKVDEKEAGEQAKV